MPRYQHLLFKASRAIYQELLRLGEGAPVPPLPGETWQRVINLQRQIAFARACGWSAAGADQNSCVPTSCRGTSAGDESSLGEFGSGAGAPAARQSRRDLSGFGGLASGTVGTDRRPGARSAVRHARSRSSWTRFLWAALRSVWTGGKFAVRMSPTAIVALNPNPAATDDSVTHPHVRGERLCEGEGRTTIRRRWPKVASSIFLRLSIGCCIPTPVGKRMWSWSAGAACAAADCSSIVD